MGYICLEGEIDWQKFILQNYKIYYFKYQEFWGVYTINNHVSDNSIQININSTVIVCEYIIVSLNYNKYIYKYIYKNLKSWQTLCASFFVTLSENIYNTPVTLVSYSHNFLSAATAWTLSLVKAAYPTDVKMFQVINRGNNNDLVKTFLLHQGEVLTGFKQTLSHLTGKLLL